jgi:putative transposase
LLGYCLMTNHVHLIVVPATESSLAKALGRAHWVYTQAINRLHGRSGHLWQNRFHSCALDDDRLWTALRYVENNPVRARVVRRAWNYPWSSALSHVNAERGGDDLLDFAEWRRVFTPHEWRETLLAATTEAETEGWDRLRFHTGRGRPLGSDRFIAKLETALNRRLRTLRPGRQPASPPKR